MTALRKRAKTVKRYSTVKCTKCGDELFGNTRKKMVYCECKAIAVDGCEDYVRIIGSEKDYRMMEKKKLE